VGEVKERIFSLRFSMISTDLGQIFGEKENYGKARERRDQRNQ
jgi:hypothetical protein